MSEQVDFRKLVRRRAWLMLLVVSVVVLLLFLITTLSHLRSDWTEGEVYTLSPSTISLLDQLEEPVLIRAYITSGLPQPYGRLKRFLEDMLHAYHEAGAGNIGFEVIDPAADPNTAAALTAMNIPKVQVQVIEDDQAQVKQGYLAVVIEYLDRKEIIPVVQSEAGFEYLLTRKIKKLTGKGRAKVGILSGFGVSDLYQLRKLQEFTADDYELIEVEGENGSIPADIKTLIIAGMSHAPTESFRDQLGRFREEGGGLLLLAGAAKPQLSSGFQVESVDPYANDWIKDDLGIAIESGLVMDQRATRVTLNQRQGGFMFRSVVDYLFIPKVSELDLKHVVTGGLESVSLPFVSPLLPIDGKGEYAELMHSSQRATVQFGPPFDVDPLIDKERRFSGLTLRPSLLAVASNAPARTVVIGSPSLLNDEFLDGSNLVALLNIIDWLSGDQALIELRSRGVTQRPLAELSSAGRSFFKGLWMFGLPLLIASIGLWRWWRLKRQRSQFS